MVLKCYVRLRLASRSGVAGKDDHRQIHESDKQSRVKNALPGVLHFPILFLHRSGAAFTTTETPIS